MAAGSPKVRDPKETGIEKMSQTDSKDVCNLIVPSLLPYSIGHTVQRWCNVEKDYIV